MNDPTIYAPVLEGVASEMKQELKVYLHSVYAGRLSRGFFGAISFTYDPAYVAQGLPALSLSLPLREQRYQGKIVSAFFFGALPDLVSMRPTPARFIRRWLWNCFPGSFARKLKERYSYLPVRKRWAWLIEKGIEVGAVDIRPHGVSPTVSDKSAEQFLDRGLLIDRMVENPCLYASVRSPLK
ncbi:MAG: HipA N-terminal domain-containing protein [Gammaproteobacteria bacterium]|nr:HipA N-terminal domain-containing protein [Gammaproteobacteria bacterium]